MTPDGRERAMRQYAEGVTTTIDVAELQARLDEFLDRAQRGERIVVRRAGVAAITLGPASAEDRAQATATMRRRHRSDRSVSQVLAEDRGA
jgi:prevent-host-death family protein